MRRFPPVLLFGRGVSLRFISAPVFLSAVFALATTVPLSAEPIRVTGGTVQVSPLIKGVRINLEGNGFLIQTGANEDFFTPLANCQPCESPVVNMGGVWRPGEVLGGEAMVNGVRYDQVFFSTAFPGPGTRATFTTPDIRLTGTGSQTFTAPFKLSGSFDAYSSSNLENRLFTVSVVGGGTARAQFSSFEFNGQTLYNNTLLPGADFTLEYQFAPVPEPGTLLLVATGVVSVASRARRRAKRQVPA